MVGVAVDRLSCPLADEDILFTGEASSKTNSLVACVSSLSVGLHYVLLGIFHLPENHTKLAFSWNSVECILTL